MRAGERRIIRFDAILRSKVDEQRKAMSKHLSFGLLVLSFWLGGGACAASSPAELEACEKLVIQGFRPIAEDRAKRFTGKVTKEAALCRGGDKAVKFGNTPW